MCLNCVNNLKLSTDKELTAAKERQEIELAAQRATLQEQRKHIGILDKALQNAQQNSRCLAEEVSITGCNTRFPYLVSCNLTNGTFLSSCARSRPS